MATARKPASPKPAVITTVDVATRAIHVTNDTNGAVDTTATIETQVANGTRTNTLLACSVECCHGWCPALCSYAGHKHRTSLVAELLDESHGLGQHGVQVGFGVWFGDVDQPDVDLLDSRR